MDPASVSAHAKTVRDVLITLGPRPRTRIILMLLGLGLDRQDAEQVVAHGLEHDLIETDPTDRSILRAK
jgi:hypothetical protein